jgi:cystathionine beta-lyase family protein involved in aluminum resistance
MELYNMPVQRRNFLIKLALKHNENEKKAMDKAKGLQEASPGNNGLNQKSSLIPGFVTKK